MVTYVCPVEKCQELHEFLHNIGHIIGTGPGCVIYWHIIGTAPVMLFIDTSLEQALLMLFIDKFSIDISSEQASVMLFIDICSIDISLEVAPVMLFIDICPIDIDISICMVYLISFEFISFIGFLWLRLLLHYILLKIRTWYSCSSAFIYSVWSGHVYGVIKAREPQFPIVL